MPIHPFYWTDDDSLMRVENGSIIVPRFEILHVFEVVPSSYKKHIGYKTFIYRDSLSELRLNIQRSRMM